MTEIECAFTGRIATEPATRTGKTGKPWLGFSVVVGEGEAAQFVQVALFGDSVSDASAWLAKGVSVYCEGKIKLNNWTTADGTQRAGLSVASFKVEPLGQIGRKKASGTNRRDDEQSAGHAAAVPRRASAKADYARPRETAQRAVASRLTTEDQAIPF